MGFKVDGRDMTKDDFSKDVPSNSTGMISKEHGEWAFPLWPQINLVGSPVTPYIYDSRPSIEDITSQLNSAYKLGKDERKRRGLSGRNWAINNGFTANSMAKGIMDGIDTCLKSFKPRQRFNFEKVTNNNDEKYPIGDLK